MYDKIKVLFDNPTYRYFIIGGISIVLILCAGYIFYQPSGTDYQRTLKTVERIERQQRESVELNRSIQSSIDRSSTLGHEAKGRVERSQEYNQQIGERIDASQASINEARSYLKRNAELFDRIERANRERQTDYQATTDTTQPIPDGGSGSSNRSGNSSMTER